MNAPYTIIRSSIVALLCLTSAGTAVAYNYSIKPTITSGDLANYLGNPKGATVWKFNAADNVGNAMHCPSVMQIDDVSFKYVAVYHSPTLVKNGKYAFDVNLGGSNDLMNWTFIRKLAGNASMPKISRVDNSEWIVVVHEQWMNIDGDGAILAPCQVGFKLFHSAGDLLYGTVRSTWIQPQQLNSTLNGTPSFYNMSLQQDTNGNKYVHGQYGFHFNNGANDLPANTTILYLFDPLGRTAAYPSYAEGYTNVLRNAGVAGDIGQRDTVTTSNARYNIQEGNLAMPLDWSKWRLFLYKFNDNYDYPTGNGTVEAIFPATPGGSRSFGNPSVSLVTRPGGGGYAMFVSYFIFGEDNAPGEAGSLIYYYEVGAGNYDAWINTWTVPTPTGKNPGDDPDGDGIVNLMEYVIGGDPRVSSASHLPTQSKDGSYLVLSYKRNDDSKSDTTQTGQWSTDMIHWTDIAPVLIHDNGTAPDDMQIRIPLTNAANGELFGRLRVTRP